MTSFALLRIHKDIDASRLADPAQAVDELVTPPSRMIGHARLIHKDGAPMPRLQLNLACVFIRRAIFSRSVFVRPHRLAAKDTALSRRRSRVRIPLGVPFLSKSLRLMYGLPARARGGYDN